MVTASKRWAIVSGAVVTGVVIVVGAWLSRSPPGANDHVMALVAAPPAAAPQPMRGLDGSGSAAAGLVPGKSLTPAAALPDAGKTATDVKAADPLAADPLSASARLAQPLVADPATVASIAPPDQRASRPVAQGAGEPADQVPHFDVVRVEPNGDAVLAGQGAPNVLVELVASGTVASGTVLAQASTDATGHFVMLPPALAPGDYALVLRQPVAGKTALSAQSVTVSVPGKGKGPVVVALAEPGQATKLLSAPPAAETAPAGAPAVKTAAARSTGSPSAASKTASDKAGLDKTGAGTGAAAKTETGKTTIAKLETPKDGAASGPALAIRSVELENGNGFFASGVAAPGTRLRVYLNNSHVADVAAGADTGWSVKIRKGLLGGHYVVRADASTDGTTVSARVEVPFDVPLAPPVAVSAVVPPVAPALSPSLPAIASAAAPVVVALAPPAAAPVMPVVPAAPISTAAPITQSAAVPITQSAAVPITQSAAAPISQPAAAPISQPAAAPISQPAAAPISQPAAAPGLPPTGAPSVQASTAADAVIDEVRTAVVRTGDNLWDISRVRLGQGWRYTRIYAANAAQIRDPRLIYPGQVFVLPAEND